MWQMRIPQEAFMDALHAQAEALLLMLRPCISHHISLARIATASI
jgi:hypothetical protein